MMLLLPLLLPLLTLPICPVTSSSSKSAASDLTFLSGFADTIQYFSIARQQQHGSSDDEQRSKQVFIKRHHLVCLHKGPFSKHDKVGRSPSEKCCNDLWLKGLIESHQRRYCLDHLALLPDVPPPAAAVETLLKDAFIPRKDARPMFYVAIDEEITQNDEGSIYATYRQVRNVMARDEHKERESIRDLPNHGVGTYSPFHLAGFMPGGQDILQYYDQWIDDGNRHVSLMIGRVNGTLSSEGGIHRAFHQRITISMDRIKLLQTSGECLLNIGATVFLPLIESVFIDADDPFLVEYDDSSADAILCQASLLNNTSHKNQIVVANSKCNIAFVSSETIDIEQPSFASRQYVVAFQIEATIELSVGAPTEVLQNVNIGIDYGAMLHLRYLMPISTHSNGGVASVYDGTDGLVPIAIQQPILYSGSMVLKSKESSKFEQHFLLDTGSSAHAQRWTERTSDPIIVHVAVGIDDDYWWVTSVTMFSAMIGGLVIMRSVDSVSIWC